MIPKIQLIILMQRFLNFPNPTICRHHVVACLLNEFEKAGYIVPEALASAVVNADDEKALALLTEFAENI